MKQFVLFGLGGLLLMAACQGGPQEKEGKYRNGIYFSVDSIFFLLKDSLLQPPEDYTVEKTARLNGKEESGRLQSPDWEKNLGILRKYDINKSSWQGQFQVREQQRGDTALTLYSTDREDIPVKKLRVMRQGQKLLGLSGKIREEHALFSLKKSFRLHFHPEKPEKELSMEMRGREKMILTDREEYRIRLKVRKGG